MKSTVYLPLIAVLLIAEAFAVFLLISAGEEKFKFTGTLHIVVACVFGVVTGIRRRSIPVGLLSVLVIGTTPLVGIFTMILLDDKFNRATRKRFFESSDNFRAGNPFISIGGNVELPEIDSLVEREKSAMNRVLDVKYHLSEREVEALSYSRDAELLSLLEKVASTTSGDGRVLAQAAIAEILDRTATWSANLHRLQLHQKPIPPALERLAVASYLAIRKVGRNPQSFGLPESSELVNLLEERLKQSPNTQTIVDLFDLHLLEEHIDNATHVLQKYSEFPGLNHQLLMAKLQATKGEWIDLVKLSPAQFGELQLNEQESGVRQFWAIDRPNNLPAS